MRGPRLAEILLQSGLAKEDDLRLARRAAEERGGSLLLQLVEGGAVDETALVRALGRGLRMATVSLRGKKVDPEVLRLVPAELAERYGCLPLFVKEEGGSRALYLGVEDPTDQAVADDVSFRVGLRIIPVVVGPVELRRALRAALAQASPPPAVAAPPLPEQPVAVRDTAPELGDVALGSDDEGSDGPKDEAGKPRDVPTREILRAVTRLLLEKEVFSRAELLEAVRAVRDGEGGAGDA
jgi:Type II secretion system (T2SS), protein E, N-terminal domain